MRWESNSDWWLWITFKRWLGDYIPCTSVGMKTVNCLFKQLVVFTQCGWVFPSTVPSDCRGIWQTWSTEATVPSTNWPEFLAPMHSWASSMKLVTLLPSVPAAWWTGSVSTVTGKYARNLLTVCAPGCNGVWRMKSRVWDVCLGNEKTICRPLGGICGIIVPFKELTPLYFAFPGACS